MLRENSIRDEFFQPVQLPDARLWLEWFCRCAVDFYAAKGFDISDLPLAEFEQRLYLDCFTKEFYEVYWTSYFITESARVSSASALQMIYRLAARAPFQSFEENPDPESETGADQAAENGTEDEQWADFIEVE